MKNNNAVSLSLIFQHFPMLRAMGKIVLKQVQPKRLHQSNMAWQEIPAISQTISPPQDQLIDAYIKWSGAPQGKYEHTLPPHMVSQWGLAIGTELILQTSYNLVNVINQGVGLRILGDLPRHQPLVLKSKIDSIREDQGIAKITIKMTTGTAEQPVLVESYLHMAFLLPEFKKSKSPIQHQNIEWENIGSWQASKNDGFKFALLTGDFNPIHWVSLAGKLSAFKNMVLHGFGMFVRSYETLPLIPQQIDVRFLKPVVLPSSDLMVEIEKPTDTQDLRQIRLVGAQNKVHLSGAFKV